MTIAYRAIDGKIFYDKFSCKEYEEKNGLNEMQNNVKCYNSFGNLIDIAQSLLTFENVYIIEIKSETAGEKFLELLESNTINDIDGLDKYPNTYFYNSTLSSWISVLEFEQGNVYELYRIAKKIQDSNNEEN